MKHLLLVLLLIHFLHPAHAQGPQLLKDINLDTSAIDLYDSKLIEYNGKTYLYYAIGDQATWTSIRVAMYDGPMKSFFESHFPEKQQFRKLSTKN